MDGIVGGVQARITRLETRQIDRIRGAQACSGSGKAVDFAGEIRRIVKHKHAVTLATVEAVVESNAQVRRGVELKCAVLDDGTAAADGSEEINLAAGNRLDRAAGVLDHTADVKLAAVACFERAGVCDDVAAGIEGEGGPGNIGVDRAG